MANKNLINRFSAHLNRKSHIYAQRLLKHPATYALMFYVASLIIIHSVGWSTLLSSSFLLGCQLVQLLSAFIVLIAFRDLTELLIIESHTPKNQGSFAEQASNQHQQNNTTAFKQCMLFLWPIIWSVWLFQSCFFSLKSIYYICSFTQQTPIPNWFSQSHQWMGFVNIAFVVLLVIFTILTICFCVFYGKDAIQATNSTNSTAVKSEEKAFSPSNTKKPQTPTPLPAQKQDESPQNKEETGATLGGTACDSS